MDLCNINEIKALLARNGFRFSKSMGQNFLIQSWVPEDIAAADLASASVASLQAESGETGLSLENVVGSESPEEGMIERVALRTAIDSLPERQRKLILLRYFKGLTQDKTAKI